MARKKPGKAVRRKNETTALVRIQDAKQRNVSVKDLAALAEGRFDSGEAAAAFEEKVASYRPGTVGAAKLVTAADALEDEDLLLGLAGRGILEALRSNTMRQRIADEVLQLRDDGVLQDVANAQAAVGLSSPDEYPGAWIIAEFGDAIAANGTLLNDDDKIPDRPESFVLTDRGGNVPDMIEYVHPTTIVGDVLRGLGVSGSDAEKIVLEVLLDEHQHGIPVRVSGTTEIWMDESVASQPADSFDADA